jgi:UDP-glucose:(glucosyl)LPS alpha-1,2-glucosyltransferase
MGFERNEISVNAQGGTEIMRDLLEKNLNPELLSNFQIIFSRPRNLDPTKIRIFQAHDLPEDPESAKVNIDHFHKLVFISNWQYQRYQLIRNIPYNNKSIILESGIEPAPEDVFDKKDKEVIRLVYTSTPQRGLKILVPVFKKLCEFHENIHLDVFSSFKIYGWDEPQEFINLYEEIKQHPKMTYHGFVPNDTLKEYLHKAHIFAYPNIWIETSCRAMLEAMSAGLMCVHPNYGALPETSGALNVMYQGNMENIADHANTFASHLNATIEFVKNNSHLEIVKFNKMYIDSRYNINRIKLQWELMLKDLLELYPTVESRKIAKEMFVYKR